MLELKRINLILKICFPLLMLIILFNQCSTKSPTSPDEITLEQGGVKLGCGYLVEIKRGASSYTEEGKDPHGHYYQVTFSRITYENELTGSPIIGYEAKIEGKVLVYGTPKLSISIWPEGGTYVVPISVKLISSEDVTIYYTLDGSTPTLESEQYLTPIPISTEKVIKFFGKTSYPGFWGFLRGTTSDQMEVQYDFFPIIIEKKYNIQNEVCGLAWDGENLWLLKSDLGGMVNDNKIYKVDGYGNEIDTIQFPYAAMGVAYSGNGFWLGYSIRSNPYRDLNVFHINRSGTITDSIKCDFPVSQLVWDGNYLWTVNRLDLIQFNTNGDIIKTLKLDYLSELEHIPTLTWDGKNLWIRNSPMYRQGESGFDILYKLDNNGQLVQKIHLKGLMENYTAREYFRSGPPMLFGGDNLFFVRSCNFESVELNEIFVLSFP